MEELQETANQRHVWLAYIKGIAFKRGRRQAQPDLQDSDLIFA